MPIPILFIGIAVATGAVGIGKTTKAGFDQYNAKKLANHAHTAPLARSFSTTVTEK